MRKIYRVDLYVPESHIDEVKDAMFKAGAGKIGEYDSCCWQTEGTGQFRALDGSNPFIGDTGKLEKVKEYKIELICQPDDLEKIINAMINSHPYEMPAYQIIECFVCS